MYINSYISKGQHVFGDYQINFSKDGEAIPFEKAEKIDISSIETEKDNKEENHYTFIIGENGTGKTSLLKSIIIGLLSKYTDYNWMEICKGGLAYSKYFGKDFTHLHEYNSAAIGFNAILLFSNYRFLFIEKGLENMYFENHLGQDGSKVPLLRMLTSYSEHLGQLNHSLRNKDCTWRIQVEYFPQPHYEYADGGKRIEINPQLQPLFMTFRELVENESNGGSQNLGEKYGELLYNIAKNQYFPSTGHPRQHYIEITQSKIYQRLLEVAPYFLEGSTSKRIYNDREHSAYHIDSNVMGSLTEQDLWIIPLLADTGLIRYEIFLDEVPLNDLSSGEQVIIQLFCDLAPVCSKLKKKDSYLVLYDEPETSLHPKWQQQFPLLFQQVIEDIFGITDSHFIFSTHSPLILMNAANIPNSSILKFTYNNKKFKSEKIIDLPRYCIEELLLDEFGISYFSGKETAQMEDTLEHMDLTASITHTNELKTEIDNLYQKVMYQ